jgi:hypothetical protein
MNLHYRCFLFLMILTPSLFAQEMIKYPTEFGIDISPAVIAASGGDMPHSEVELIYREVSVQGDLRFKLNIGNRNYWEKELIAGKLLEDNSPISRKNLEVMYIPKTSYLASIGIAKYLKKNVIPIYYGVDLNVGMSRGETVSIIEETYLNETLGQWYAAVDNNQFMMGATPFLGVKKGISERIVLGIEFGFEVNYLFNQLEYLDESQNLVESNLNQLGPNFSKLINDISILVRI